MMNNQVTRLQELVQAQNNDLSRMITVCSGKGGVGKTNIAINLAIALAQLNKKVVVIDADTHMANVDVMLGITPKYTFMNHVLEDVPVNKVLFKHESGIYVIASSSGSRSWNDLDNSIHISMLEMLFQLKKEFDYIIVDTAGGLSRLALELATRSDKILITSTSEPTSINDTYALIKIMTSLRNNLPIELLLNMVTTPNEVTDVYQRLSLVLEHFLEVSIGITGYIELDYAVRQAVIKQQPFVIAFSDTIASQNIKSIANSIIQETVSSEA